MFAEILIAGNGFKETLVHIDIDGCFANLNESSSQTFTSGSKKAPLIKKEKQVYQRKNKEQKKDHKNKYNRPISPNPPTTQKTTPTITPDTEVATTLPAY